VAARDLKALWIAPIGHQSSLTSRVFGNKSIEIIWRAIFSLPFCCLFESLGIAGVMHVSFRRISQRKLKAL
jgi:hypothetical protein